MVKGNEFVDEEKMRIGYAQIINGFSRQTFEIMHEIIGKKPDCTSLKRRECRICFLRIGLQEISQLREGFPRRNTSLCAPHCFDHIIFDFKLKIRIEGDKGISCDMERTFPALEEYRIQRNKLFVECSRRLERDLE